MIGSSQTAVSNSLDPIILGLLGRAVLINVAPFFLVFHMVMRRRQHFHGRPDSVLNLLADEFKIVGILGYVVILSIFFFSIPVLRYLKTKPGYDIILVQPDGFTVYLIATLSFTLVVAGVYLKLRKKWAYFLLLFLVWILLIYAFFTILEWGLISMVPVLLFAYLRYRLVQPALRRELFGEILPRGGKI